MEATAIGLQTAKRSFTFATNHPTRTRNHRPVSKPLSGRSLLQEGRDFALWPRYSVSKPLSGRSLLQGGKDHCSRTEGCHVSKPLSGRSLLQGKE